jgi:RNA polymerase sigma-70 factor (ECF subfamily)
VSAGHDFDEIFRETGPRLWRALLAYAAGRRDVADDALAEAFARAMERRAAVRDPEAYLYRIAFRVAAAELRRPAPKDPVDPIVEADPGLVELFAALRWLSPSQRAAVYLHYYADLPIAEVARLMGTSAAAVKVPDAHSSRSRWSMSPSSRAFLTAKSR